MLREWKRIVEGGCADILNILRERPSDLGDVQVRLAAGFGRSAAQASRVLFLASGGGSLDSTLDMRARAYLRYRARKTFHRGIDVVRNGSDCGLAKNEPFQDAHGHWSLVARCKKDDKICRQDDFLDEQRGRAEAAANGLVASAERDPDKKMGRKMLKMLPIPRECKGKNCYWDTGDVSIALECDPDEVLLTTDRSFEAIAPALGVRMHRLKATSPPKSSILGTP